MRYILTFLTAILLSNLSNSQEIARLEQFEINSSILNQKRPILVSLPQDYNEKTLVDFDVIYVFDSQNREIFDLVHSSINFMSNSKPFIVIGITSPSFDDEKYYRNNDMAPLPRNVKIEDYPIEGAPNRANFLRFFKEEVLPLVEKNYRTTNKKIAVGHSMSASLILSTLVSDTSLFNHYIAISPSFAYDANVLSNDIISFNYSKIENPKFVYLSHANEGIDYWKDWKPAREKVYDFISDSTKTRNNVRFEHEGFPEMNHWNSYLHSFTSGFQRYLNFSKSQTEELSKEFYEITVTVKVPNKNDTVYITGNQETLGNWDPKKIKLKSVSDFERSISLRIQSPAEVQFTKGNWESKAEVNKLYFAYNIRIEPKKQKEFHFEILAWANDFD